MKNLVAHLKKRIKECDPGDEGIPGWCVSTGKCTCTRSLALIKRLERATPAARAMAAEAYALGDAVEKYNV